MTHSLPDSTELVEVTQADRDAAAAHYIFVQSRIKGPHGEVLQARINEDIRSGRWDKDESIQAFARHRIEALTEHLKAARREERESERERCAAIVDALEPKHRRWVNRQQVLAAIRTTPKDGEQ